MKLFTTAQIAALDSYTIENEPISAIDLMERASSVFVDSLLEDIAHQSEFVVFCGPGNNGGDGLSIARMLSSNSTIGSVTVYVLDLGKGFTPSFDINIKRLTEQGVAKINVVKTADQIPILKEKMVVIDALFGSGLNRPLEGLAAHLVQHINQSGAMVYAVDIPSGLMGEDNTQNSPSTIIRANTTITFQFPKLSFLFPENEEYIGRLKVEAIGLHKKGMRETAAIGYLLEKEDIVPIIKPRAKFSHKGTYGHALLISGSWGRMGAAVLASKACLRSGVGLLTTHVPNNCYQMLQTAVPETMCEIGRSDLMFTQAPDLKSYSAVGIGPAIGTKADSQRGFHQLIKAVQVPLVVDADALTMLSGNREWMSELPKNTILTPHPKEFDRLAGSSASGWERLQKAKELAKKYELIVVLKGAYTQIVDPKGEVWFNSTGNPGMATAGSGDVLTGIILAWLAQGYVPLEAAKIGVYVHGLAGDIAATNVGQISLIASSIVDHLHSAYSELNK